ncbi:hypothetical protein QE152_g27773 [Popillia japonica]|uniref:Uncharacterized protein n=1 Tax=Popillia japonica TaxID=7064 RepID=A0AAW1JLC6_POPJA
MQEKDRCPRKKRISDHGTRGPATTEEEDNINVNLLLSKYAFGIECTGSRLFIYFYHKSIDDLTKNCLLHTYVRNKNLGIRLLS